MARAAGAQGTKKRRYGMFHSIHDANPARAKSRIYKNDGKRYNNPANARRKPLCMEVWSPYAGGGVVAHPVPAFAIFMCLAGFIIILYFPDFN